MPTDDRFRPIYITFDGGEFHFDAVLQEKHEITSTITEHPVEEGSNIADHVRPDPIVLNIQGVVTNTPIVAIGTDGWQRTPQILGPGEYHIEEAKPKDPPGTPPIIISPPQPPLLGLLSLNGAVNALSNAIFGDGTFTLQQSSDRNTLPNQRYNALVDVSSLVRNFIAEALSVLTQLRDEATLCTVIAPHKGPYNNMVVTKVMFSRGSSEAGKGTFDIELREIRIVSSAVVAAPKPSIPRANPPVTSGAQAPAPTTDPQAGILFKAAH
jgi:hypothetical protein